MERIGRGQVPDPQHEGLVTHLDGEHQHLVEREEHRDLEEDRQAPGQRVHALFLVELHDLLLLERLVVLVALLDGLHLGLERAHGRHRGELALGDREHDAAHQQGQQDDRQAEVLDRLEQRVEQPEDRLFEPAEPAPVDRERQVRHALLLVGFKDVVFLGTGEQAHGLALRLAGGHGGGGPDQVSGKEVVAQRAEIGRGLGAISRDQRGEPVDVGKAQPVGLACRADRAGLGDIGVVVREVHRTVEGADGARVDLPGVLAHRLVGAVDAREGGNRDSAGRGVAHALRHGQHVVVVDRVAQGERLARRVGPLEGDRGGGRQLRAIGGEQGLPVGGNDAVLAEPAHLRKVLRRGACGREQAHGRAVLGDGFAVTGQRQVVDHAADQIDRALETRRVDRHAVARAQRLRQIALFERNVIGRDKATLAGRLGGRAAAGRDGRRRARGGDRRVLGVRIEIGDAVIPADQQQAHQGHRQDQVALFLHCASRIVFRNVWERAGRKPAYGTGS